MSSINTGSQHVYSAFQYLATGDNFQQGFRDAIRPGIYSGGTVSIVAANQVQISNMRVVFRSTDISANKVTHISFNTPVILNTPNAPNGDYTLYLTYGYLPNLNNFADFGIRLTSAPAIPDEVRICRVVNDGAGAATSILYTNRTRGTIDTDNNDELTTDVDPTQDWHVGNRAYNDLRYVNQNGPNTWDIQVLKTTDGSLGTSRVWFQGTAAREWELQDRSMVLADNRAAFQLGDIKSTIATITPTDLTPWLDISVDYVTLNASGAGSWPLLVPHLRGLSGGTGYVVNGYAPGVSTVLQMDSGDPATAAFVLALYEDNLYHGGNVENYANYKTITVSTAFGTDIPVGEYNILDIDPIAYTIEIDASTSGPSALGTIDHYPFRIKSSTTTARWFKVNDSVLATSSTETPLLYRVRDRSQKHKHLDNGHIHGGVYAALALALGTIIGALFGVTGSPSANTYGGAADIGEAVDSGTGAGTPRTGNTTRARGFAVNKYIYGVIYQP